MSTSKRRATLRKADIERAVKGAMDAGLTVTRIEIEGCKYAICTSNDMTHQTNVDDLDRELAEFEARRGQD